MTFVVSLAARLSRCLRENERQDKPDDSPPFARESRDEETRKRNIAICPLKFGESYLEGRAGDVSLGLSEVFESVLNSSRIATKKMEKQKVRP
jgi:hypothetical protein